jgi:pimeloyl-ACP methyl ester carboxylesterase/DNA-binding CsgD family transcriptional regulator
VEPRIRHAKTSDGVNIGFFRLGNGPPVVFASNAFGDAHFYRSLHPHTRRMTDGLVEAGWSVVRHDVRGMGSSSRAVPEMSADAFVRDVEAVVHMLGLQSFALAGLHGGAATAIHYTSRHPDRVSRLVLLNPFKSGRYLFEVDPVGRAVASVSNIAQDQFSFFSLIAGNLMTRFANPDHARDLAVIFESSTSPQTHLAYLEALRQIDLTDLLPQLQVPTLVVHDTGFPFGSFEERDKLAAAMPQARLVVIPGDGAAEIAAIDSFLREAREDRTKSWSIGSTGNVRLTPRETEVLALIAKGKTNREIAEILVLSERTVARHITNLYEKLDLRSKAEATAFAIHSGLT